MWSSRSTLSTEKIFFDQLIQESYRDGKPLYAGRLLERAAQRAPEAQALLYQDTAVSYKQLYAQSQRVMRFLGEKGVGPKTRVLMCVENSINFYRAYFGIWQTGAVVAPLNIFLKQEEIIHIVGDAKPVLVICSDERRAEFEAALSQTNQSCPLVGTSDIENIIVDQSEPDWNYQPIDLDEHEISALLYTSGTTGMPKGVMLSSHNIMMNIAQGISRLHFHKGEERIFAVLPLFHSFAQLTCVWGAFFMCCTVIVVPKIDRTAILQGLSQRPTFLFGVPALYGLLCLFKTLDLSSVNYFVSGGDMLSDKIRAAFALVYRRKLVNGYGLTETSPLISVDFDDVIRPTGDVGKPCLDIDCEIRDERGMVLPQGSIGTLFVRGPNVMLGYYDAKEQTQKVLHDGWLDTGDLAYLSEHGTIVLTGRAKDLIVHKGMNIYPAEVENIISLHPNVLLVGVIGQKDNGEEVPIAYVQLRSDDEQMSQELRQLCLKHLATYKVPRRFVCSSKRLPTTATGKVDKKVLRQWINDEQA